MFSIRYLILGLVLAIALRQEYNGGLSGGSSVDAAPQPSFSQGPDSSKKNVLRVGAWNINGLLAKSENKYFKIPIVAKLLNQYKFDIFVVDESKTSGLTDLSVLDIAGYSYIREERIPGNKGGGVLVYISDRVKLGSVTSVVSQNTQYAANKEGSLQYVHLKVNIGQSSWHIVGTYLTPITNGYNRLTQLKDFTNFLNNQDNKNPQNIIILGDFNINTFPSKTAPVPPYPSSDVTAAGFRQLITSTTSQSYRRAKGALVGEFSYAGLDHIYVKANEKVEESGVIEQWDNRTPPLKNFHHIIYCTVSTSGKRQQQSTDNDGSNKRQKQSTDNDGDVIG